VDELRSRPRIIVWGHQDDGGAAEREPLIEDVSDVWRSCSRRGDEDGPLERFEPDRAEEGEHRVACGEIPPMNHHDASRVIRVCGAWRFICATADPLPGGPVIRRSVTS